MNPRLGMVAHTFIPELQGQRQMNLCELEANMVYKEISRTANVVI